MSAPGERLRILLADPDADRRAHVRAALADAFALVEAASAEEVFGWLDLGDLGITLLDTTLPGAGIPELVARIRELHPQEMVLIVVDEPSVGLCRAAMRAGAYDCVGRADLDAAQLQALCEAAARRREERARAQRAAGVSGRLAVRAHEREAAVRLCPPATLALWKSIDVDERARWMESWDRAVLAADNATERQRALDDLAEGLARQPRAAELLPALHLHAAGTVRHKGREDALERARDVLVEALQRLVDRRPVPAESGVRAGVVPAAPPPASASLSTGSGARASQALHPPPLRVSTQRGPIPSGRSDRRPAPLSEEVVAQRRATHASGPVPAVASAPAPAPAAPGPTPLTRSKAGSRAEELPDLLWHRWCLADGGEEWTLVGEGRPLARVSVIADGCRAWIRDQDNGGRVVAASLPPVPAGLREVERRLGLQPVLTVRSASVAG